MRKRFQKKLELGGGGRERDESITQSIAECQKLSQREQKQKYDNIERIMPKLELCQNFVLIGKVRWCNEKPQNVVGNGRVNISFDFNIFFLIYFLYCTCTCKIFFKHFFDIGTPF